MTVENAKAQQAAIDSAFEGIFKIILALFLHPIFCFVGFWIICTVSLFMLAPALGLAESWGNSLETVPDWYRYTALGAPALLAIALRKIVPAVMKWLFIAIVSALVLFGGIKLGIYLYNR